MSKAWDTAVIKSDSNDPNKGRAGVVRAVDEGAGTVSLTLDQVGDKPQIDVTAKIADCTFHTVNA